MMNKQPVDSTQTYSFGRMGNDRTMVFQCVSISILCHLILFMSVIFMPTRAPQRRFLPSVINVSMVSLPPKATSPGSSAQNAYIQKKRPANQKTTEKQVVVPEKIEKETITAEKPEISKAYQDKPESQIPKEKEPQVEKIKPETEAQIDKKPSETVSLAPSNKIKTSLKQKTFKPSKVVKSAIARIEEKTETDRPQSVTEAIDRLKNKVGKANSKDQPEKETQPGVNGEKDGVPGGSRVGHARALELIDIYKTEISYHIEKNWVFNEQLAEGRKDLAAILVIKIMPDGEIRDIWFEKKSGNDYFDDSAYKAVKKSSPLPPLPKGYLRPFYNIGLIFTPSGLRKGMLH